MSIFVNTRSKVTINKYTMLFVNAIHPGIRLYGHPGGEFVKVYQFLYF